MSTTTDSRHLPARWIITLCAIATLSVGPVALGQNLQGYWTKDENVKDTEPPGTPGSGWGVLPADGAIRITLAPGEKIWFGFRNEQWLGWYKFLHFQIRPFPGSQLYTKQVVGFDDNGNPVRARQHGFGFDPSGRDETWRFDEQPEWERIEFTPTLFAIDNEQFYIRARSACTFKWRTAPSRIYFSLEDTTFGAPGAMDGEPRVKKLWIFPRRWVIDPDLEGLFSAPPLSGDWTYEHVDSDPEGNPRPFGGVQWSTDGNGLVTGDRFDLELPMLGHLDRRYDVYTLDEETGEINRFVFSAPRWNDALDEYEPGPLAGQGGWEPWDGDPFAAGFTVEAEQAHSGPQALAIDGLDDAVHPFAGYTYGVQELTAWVYVPDDMEDTQSFILLNAYPAADAHDWSLQLELNGAEGVIADRNGDASLPLRRGAWTPIRVLIDLDRDTQTVWYDGVRMLDKSWTAGVAEGGALNIGAVDLFGSGSAHAVYYDDLLLDDGEARGACTLGNGSCIGPVHPDLCGAVDGVYLGHETTCANDCPADISGNGAVGFEDILLVLGSWGECAGCPADLNGDGVVTFADLLIVLGGWGPCDGG